MKKKIQLILLCFSCYACGAQDLHVYYTPVKNAPYVWDAYHYTFDTKTLAEDMADLLKQATGLNYTASPGIPAKKEGILLVVDSNFKTKSNEEALAECDGKKFLKITAQYTTGLSYGIYTYLQKAGFKFYMPGDQWTIIPSLRSAFTGVISKQTWKPYFKHRYFAISGAMLPVKGLDDENRNYKEWIKWYRRNRMGSEYGAFGGHIGELFNITHKKEIEADPSILAPVNNKRGYNEEGKIDPTNEKGVNLFINWAIQQYKANNDPVPWYLPWSKFQSVDPGDGLNYCHSPECLAKFKSVSDQVFDVANKAARRIRLSYPQAGVNTYAYTERTDTPSVKLEPNIHVGIVSGAFHNVATPASLIRRWAAKTTHISIYDYINIGVWNRDAPFFNLDEYFKFLEYNRLLKLDGFTYESGGGNLSAGLMQFFILKYLCEPYTDINKEFEQFTKDCFGKAAAPLNSMMHEWYFSNTHQGTLYDFASFYDDEIGRFFALIRQASQLPELEKEQRKRISELKAYVIYLAKQFELGNDLNSQAAYKTDPGLRKQKAEDILSFTWKMYDKMIFHNTQLNDVYKSYFTGDDARLQKWDYNKSPSFKNITAGADEMIESLFQKMSATYIPKATPYFGMPDSLLEKTAKFSPDSIVIRMIDPDYFPSFRYPLELYCPAPGPVMINFTTEKSRLENPAVTNSGFIAALSADFLYNQDYYIGKENRSGAYTFYLPKKGHYKLYLAQNNSTAIRYVIRPGKNLIYVNKKVIPMNAVMLQGQGDDAEKGNKYLALYIPNTDSVNYNMLCIDCANYVKLYAPSGKPKEMNVSGSPYNISTKIKGEEKNNYLFMSNDLRVWTAIMKNVPPYYFFLRFPLKAPGK